MAINAQSIPMRWTWQDPSLLALVQGTPINCLVINWASGAAADAGQQQAMKPLIEAGKKAGLDFVGLVEGSADKAAAMASAKAAGLSAVAMDAPPAGNVGIPVIAWGKSGDALWQSSSAVVAIADGFWPSVPQEKTPTGGPTNLPWVDSNGALLAMAKALAPAKTFWVVSEPPAPAPPTAGRGGPEGARGGGRGGPVSNTAPDNYALAVADSATYGGRWVITLDPQTAAGLASKAAPAMEVWKKITDTVAYFEQDKVTKTYERAGRLAVMSNFTGADRFLGEESLNLLPRLREPYRVIARSQALNASFAGLEGIFYVDQDAPEAKLRQKLMAFVNGGGTLFVRAKWPNPEGTPAPISTAEAYLLFNVRTVGKGHLAVAKTDDLDAYFTCADIQNILSHKGDPLRLYNGASMNYSFQVAAQGKQGAIHVLNYTRRPSGDQVVIFVKSPFKTARFVSPELAAPVALQWVIQEAGAGGAELVLPRFNVYGAVQMEN